MLMDIKRTLQSILAPWNRPEKLSSELRPNPEEHDRAGRTFADALAQAGEPADPAIGPFGVGKRLATRPVGIHGAGPAIVSPARPDLPEARTAPRAREGLGDGPASPEDRWPRSDTTAATGQPGPGSTFLGTRAEYLLDPRGGKGTSYQGVAVRYWDVYSDGTKVLREDWSNWTGTVDTALANTDLAGGNVVAIQIGSPSPTADS
jgi:hypothetical protein